MWCIREIDEEYITRMEDILDVYEKPLDAGEPVVCLDEKPVQLLDDSRQPISARPGKIAKRDYEYVRKGTVNVFCAVEPKAGRHHNVVTANRKAPEYAKMLKRIAERYPDAETIHLVQDNLNTHAKSSLIKCFGIEKGDEIWNRFTIHYTPKHASWLNQAELAINLYSNLCIGNQRVGSIAMLREKTKNWNSFANRHNIKINWRFTKEKARAKFGYEAETNT